MYYFLARRDTIFVDSQPRFRLIYAMVLAGSGSGEPSLIGSRSEAGLVTRESPRWRRETQKGQHPRDHSRPTVRVTDCVETERPAIALSRWPLARAEFNAHGNG
jgi:hypothetical protein